MSGNRVFRSAPPLLAAALPFVAFFTLGLRYFYVDGAGWGDGGVLASLMWHSGWEQNFPEVGGGQSSFAVHMTPVFWLTSAISWFLPLTRVQFFALFGGAVQALMALSAYALLTFIGTRRWLAAVLAVLFSFNGIVLAAARNPHFELLIVACAMAFLTAVVRGKVWTARLFFILCLMTREDAGGHLSLLLLAGAACLRGQGVGWDRLRPLLIYAAVALSWSLATLAVQHLFYPGGGAMGRVYLGHPPFAGITPSVLATRLAFWLLYRPYIVLPLVVALLLATRWRVPGLAAGFAASLPWLGLNWLAASAFAGTLSNYYPFPLIFGLFWPLAWHALSEQLGAPRVLGRKQALGAFSVLLAASFIGIGRQHNPRDIDLPASFFNPPSLKTQETTDQAMALFQRLDLGRVVADTGVISLDPDHYHESQWVWAPPAQPLDTVIFFVKGAETPSALGLAQKNGLKNFYQVPGTVLRLATNKALDLKALNLTPWTPPQ